MIRGVKEREDLVSGSKHIIGSRRRGLVMFSSALATKSTIEKKKKFKGFPMFLQLKILKSAFLSDMK
jgi:hypothetical protein